VYSVLCDLYRISGDLTAARGAGEKARAVARDEEEQIWSHVALVPVLVAQGDIEGAIALCGEARRLAREPSPLSRISYELGEAYLAAGLRAKALDAFREALARQNDDNLLRANVGYSADILWRTGHLHYESGSYRAAASDLKRALEYLPTSDEHYADAQILLGHSLVAMGDVVSARAHYNMAMLSPNVTTEQREMATQCLVDIGEETNA